MSIILVQLGDIHLNGTEGETRVLALASSIGAAVGAEAADGVEVIVLAICGDIAYSGQAEEYEVAKKFVGAIEDRIRNLCGAEVRVVAVPGNHDCDFSSGETSRDSVIEKITSTQAVSGPERDAVLRPLHSFFKFSRSICREGDSLTLERPFYHSIDVACGDSFLRLHLLNTAWASSLRESPGTLRFPLAELTPPRPPAELSVALLHHPPHWQDMPAGMRSLRDRLAQLASVVLFNHEHEAEAVEQKRLDSHANEVVYIAGGALDLSGEVGKCSFNTLKFDLGTRQWHLSLHERVNDSGRQFFKAIRGPSHPIAGGGVEYQLKQEFAAYLDDPGAPITHPRRDPRAPLRLSDIYLYPDLWELDANHDGGARKQIRGENVPEVVLTTKSVLIAGGEKSGRTSLVKQLFRRSLATGKVPLLLRGTDLPRTGEAVRRAVRDCVADQYANITADEYEQLPPEHRVVFVDDIHRMRTTGASRDAVIAAIEARFSQVVVCGDDLVGVGGLGGKGAWGSRLWEYRHLVILGFGEGLRESLVRRWIGLREEVDSGEDEVDAEVERLCTLINLVIKRQLLPPYPLFLIVVLQQADVSNPNVRGGSFGHLFEGVVTAALAGSKFSQISIGDKYNYLAAMAMRMFQEKATRLGEDDCKSWHCSYWEGVELSVDFGCLADDLCSLGVLAREGGTIRFKYIYYFCFFVAYYLNQKVHEPEVRQQITELCTRLHHRVSAEIVLFLAHLTGDPIVLDEMAKACDRLFTTSSPFTIDKDVAPLNSLEGKLYGEVTLPQTAPKDNRRAMRARSDDHLPGRIAASVENEAMVAPEADSEALRQIFEIHAAFKSIQILGQALRNIAGSADRKRKEAIIEKLIGLARRLLGAYFQGFRPEFLADTVKIFAEDFREHHPDLGESEIIKHVNDRLFRLSLYICFIVVKHTSLSVGSENLGPTLRRLLSGNLGQTERVFGLSFGLDCFGGLRNDEAVRLYDDLRRNPFGQYLVRIMVAHHLYMYTVPFQRRQSICDRIGIGLPPAAILSSRKMLK
jgi:hypothetical protein